MNFILPKNLDLNSHLELYPLEEYKFCKFNIEKGKYILSLLTIIPATNKDIDDNRQESGGYVPLYSKLMQSYVQNYRQYLNYFIQTGIIETDGVYVSEFYSQGEGKSYGYRFTDAYQDKGMIIEGYSKKFNRRIMVRQRKIHNQLRKEYYHLTKWLWPTCKLKIDLDEALEYLEVRRDAQAKCPHLQQFRYNRKWRRLQTKEPNIQYYYAKINLMNASTGNMNFLVDRTVGRLHSNLTNLKSELRNLIKYENENIVSLDIINSQPYLALSLMNNKITVNKQISPYLEQLAQMLNDSSHLLDNQDVKEYISIVSGYNNNQQDLYMYMLDECVHHNVKYKNRDEVKSEMMQVFFSANRHQTETKKLFNKLFPTINDLFIKIKAGKKNVLACLLQSLESHVMLRVITKRIAREHPNAPIFTIHDNIATTERYKDVVEQIMREELTKFTGFPPKLKVDYWLPKNLNWDRYKSALASDG